MTHIIEIDHELTPSLESWPTLLFFFKTWLHGWSAECYSISHVEEKRRNHKGDYCLKILHYKVFDIRYNHAIINNVGTFFYKQEQESQPL